MRIHLVTALWGEEFTRLYLSLCLPNQLSPGNLPALAASAMPVYKVYTRSADAEVIAAHPLFRRLTTLMPTELVSLDHLFEGVVKGNIGNALLTMTAGHRAAVDAANAVGAALMFLPPDQVYSDGAFARCHELGCRGTRAVLLPGIRYAKEDLERALIRRSAETNGAWSGAPRGLLALGLPHLSPISRAMFADADPFSDAPSHIYFPVGDEGFVTRALHLHPLFVQPRRRVPLRYGNCDTDYLLDACPALGDYHIVSDSDEMLALELTPAARQLGQAGSGPLDIRKLAAFYQLFGNRLLRRFLGTPIYIHTGDLTPRWREAVRRSGEVVDGTRSSWARLMTRMRG
jgi:hypothetical protein